MNRANTNRKITNLQKRMLNLKYELNGLTNPNPQPKLNATTFNFEDPVSFDEVKPFNAWYIQPNVRNGSIHHVYDKKTLNAILSSSIKKSPLTRKPITRSNIKKLWPYQDRTAARVNVVNLTSSATHSPSAAPRTIRLRSTHLNSSVVNKLLDVFLQRQQRSMRIFLEDATTHRRLPYVISIKKNQGFTVEKKMGNHVRSRRTASTRNAVLQQVSELVSESVPGSGAGLSSEANLRWPNLWWPESIWFSGYRIMP
jgi:hypothetical protein